MHPIIEVNNLSKKFKNGTVAVDGISFSINEFETVGLIGPNSSGKTTLQRMLATVLEPSSGEISYNGRTMKTGGQKNRLRKHIGYVPQGDCLYGDLTIEENLLLFSKPYGHSIRKRRINNLLEHLDLIDRKHILARSLSGGIAKRASIAAALVHEPSILFLDEVTMGLDPTSRRRIWDLIRELKHQTTIIMTTHYLNEVDSLCNRVMLISKGKLVDFGEPKQLLAKYNAVDLDDVVEKVIRQER